jgi:hypothetical protein
MSHPVPVVIEHGIPLPIKTSQADVYRVTFSKMKPSDSFVTPNDSARKTALAVAKKLGLAVLSARAAPKDKRWRVWLIHPVEEAHNSTEVIVREDVEANEPLIKSMKRPLHEKADPEVGPPRVAPSPDDPTKFDIVPARPVKRRGRPRKTVVDAAGDESDPDDEAFFARDTFARIEKKFDCGLIDDEERNLRQDRLHAIEEKNFEEQKQIEQELLEIHG